MLADPPTTAAQSKALDRPSRLTPDSLVLADLAGKRAAIHAYDSILWKVPTGYAVIPYSALGLLSGDAPGLREELGGPLPLFALLLIAGFSVAAGVVDYSFLLGKLRVVTRVNALTDLALEMATGSGVASALSAVM